MKDKPLWITGCKLCDIFTNYNGEKIYWPQNISDIKKSEFIITDCPYCGEPIVVYRDHVNTILSETWGRILYRCKKIFGKNTKLHIYSKCELEHLNYHIVVDEI